MSEQSIDHIVDLRRIVTLGSEQIEKTYSILRADDPGCGVHGEIKTYKIDANLCVHCQVQCDAEIT